MKRTGVKASSDEVERLIGMMRAPLIAMQCGMPSDPASACHRMALEHGLPEISGGLYGIDLEDGEFLAP